MQSEYDDHQSDEENRQLAEDYTSPFRFVGLALSTFDLEPLEVQSEHDDHHSDDDIQPNYEFYIDPDVVSLLRFS